MFTPTAVLSARADANSTTSLTITQITTATQPAGGNFVYRLVYSCQNISAATCGTSPTIRIPLDNLAQFTSPAGRMNLSVAASPSVRSASVQGTDYVIVLNDLQPGASDQLSFTVSPLSPWIPNQTSWTLQPTLEFGDGTTPSATAPTPVTSTATSTPLFAFDGTTKTTAARPGETVTYTLRPRCYGGEGNETMERMLITEQIPAGYDFVSSVPPATTLTATQATWDLSGAQMLSSCPGGSGPRDITVTLRVQPTVAVGTVLTSQFVGTGDPIGTVDPNIVIPWNNSITIVSATPKPGTVNKGGAGLLNNNVGDWYSYRYLGNAYGHQSATYSGQFLPPVESTTYLPFADLSGYVEASYRMLVAYPVEGIETSIVDPMPCATNVTGTTYSSGAPGALCQSPTFHPTVVSAYTFDSGTVASMEITPGGHGIPAGFAPTVTLVDGTVVNLVQRAPSIAPQTGSAGPLIEQWLVPDSVRGRVAQLNIPRTPGLSSSGLAVTVGGYIDAARTTGDIVTNTYTTSAYLPGVVDPYATTVSSTGSIYVKQLPQIGINLSNPMPPAGAKTVTIFSNSSLVSPVPWTTDVTAVFELPAGVLPTKSTVYVPGVNNPSQGVSYPPTNLPVTVITDPATGVSRMSFTFPRDLLNAVRINGVSSPQAIFDVSIPGPGSYPVISSILTPTAIDAVCSMAQNQKLADSANLDGNAATTERCTQQVTFTVAPDANSDSTRTTKTVQGSLDSTFKSYPAVGIVPGTGGTATFRASWVNQSLSSMKDVVMYDLLPHVGDTGTIAATATRPRGSQYTPQLASLGAIPAGVTVAYSTAANPCRPEVLPNAQNPGCVDDWTTTAPADLATVTALKFMAAGPFATSAGFSVDVNMTTPVISSTQVAWNTIASVSTNATTNFTMPATETSKVGIARADIAHLDLDKTASLANAKVGDTITYTVSGFNDGNVPLNNVTLTDTLPAGLTVTNANGGTVAGSKVSWNIGTVAPGTKIARTLTVRVDAPQVAVGSSFENRLAGTADENPSVQSTNHPCSDTYTQACALVKLDPSPILAITKMVDKASAKPGDQLNYTVTVKNTGGVAGQANIVDALPLNTSFVSATGGGSYANGKVTWPTVSVPAGGQVSYQVVANINTNAWGQAVDNAATATMPSGTPALGGTCSAAAISRARATGYVGPDSGIACAGTNVTVAAPGISLTKTPSAPANGTAFVNGETVTYTFTATNSGNVPLEAVTLTEKSFTNAAGNTLTLVSGPSVTQPVGWNGALNPGGTAAWTAQYRVTAADAASHKITNTAEVASSYPASTGLTGTGPKATANAEAVTGTPLITLTKTADKTTNVKAGEVVNYTFTAQNTGDLALQGVTLTEQSFTDAAGKTITLDAAPAVSAPAGFAGTLAPGASVTWTAAHTVTQAEADTGGTLTNTAKVDAQDAGGHAVTASSTSIVNLAAQAPALNVTKTADLTSDAKVGDTINYTVTLQNTGNVTLSGVTATETSFTNGAGAPLTLTGPLAPVSTNRPDGTLPPGATASWTGTYTLTQADIDAGGVITNVATGSGTTPSGSTIEQQGTAVTGVVAAGPSLALVKTADKTSDVKSGETVTYTFTATNTGNVTITDLSIVEGEFVNGAGAPLKLTEAPKPVDGADPAAGLAPGASMSWTATYVVTDADAGGTLTNTATVKGRATGTDVVSEEATATVVVVPLPEVPTPPGAAPQPAVTPEPSSLANSGGELALGLGASMLVLFAGAILVAARRRRAVKEQ